MARKKSVFLFGELVYNTLFQYAFPPRKEMRGNCGLLAERAGNVHEVPGAATARKADLPGGRAVLKSRNRRGLIVFH